MAARGNMDDSVAVYKSTREGFVAKFARALGPTGVLTEIDVARTEQLFPEVGDSLSVARAKLRNVRSLIDEVQVQATRLLGGGESLQVEPPTTDSPDFSQYESIPMRDWPDEVLDAYLESGGG